MQYMAKIKKNNVNNDDENEVSHDPPSSIRSFQGKTIKYT